MDPKTNLKWAALFDRPLLNLIYLRLNPAFSTSPCRRFNLDRLVSYWINEAHFIVYLDSLQVPLPCRYRHTVSQAWRAVTSQLTSQSPSLPPSHPAQGCWSGQPVYHYHSRISQTYILGRGNTWGVDSGAAFQSKRLSPLLCPCLLLFMDFKQRGKF